MVDLRMADAHPSPQPSPTSPGEQAPRYPGETGDTPAWKRLDAFLKARLQHLEPVLAGREWLAGTFSVADIVMADVLRLVDRFDGLMGQPACRDYVARAIPARPSSRHMPTRWRICGGRLSNTADIAAMP